MTGDNIMHDSEDLDKYKKRLIKAVLALENEHECSAFFDDLCTINEINAMAQRFAVAVMLRNGETFSNIADLTGASTATISRVNRALKYGAGGYAAVLSKPDCAGL